MVVFVLVCFFHMCENVEGINGVGEKLASFFKWRPSNFLIYFWSQKRLTFSPNRAQITLFISLTFSHLWRYLESIFESTNRP